MFLGVFLRNKTVTLHSAMKIRVSKFKWIACIVTLLLLCIIGSDRSERCAEQTSSLASQCAFVTNETPIDIILSGPESDILTHLRETNCWGLSSNTLHLRAPAGRTLSFSNLLQRIVRMALNYISGHSTTEHLNYEQCHTIASKRFHIGYFIYHRCQMRC